jgi:adenine phosphoribosyltransferase
MDLKQIIRTVDDFPKPGIKFLDVTSILEDPAAFRYTVKWFCKQAARHQIESIVAVDARGFIWAGAIADEMRIPVYLARKPGKLPGSVVTKEYETEYSTASLSMLKDADIKGPVMVVDDIIATGGTLNAVGQLLTEHWDIPPTSQVHSALVNLDFLPGKKLLTACGYRLEYMAEY